MTLTLPQKIHRDSKDGYHYPPFLDKASQIALVTSKLKSQGFIPTNLIETEIDYFYNHLGIHDTYFENEPVSIIVDHILSLYGAKLAAYSHQSEVPKVLLDRESEDHAVYILVENIESFSYTHEYDIRIDDKYLGTSNQKRAFRLESFLTVNKNAKQYLRSYFVNICNFVNSDPTPEQQTDIYQISDKSFLEKATPNTKTIYSRIIDDALQRTGPVIEIYDVESTVQKRLVIAYQQGTALSFVSAINNLFGYYGVICSRKYVEQFSNGVTVVSCYLQKIDEKDSSHPPLEHSIQQITKDASLLYCLPRGMFFSLFSKGVLSLQETIYAHCVCYFVGHFINRLGSEYITLAEALDSTNPIHMEILSNIKRRLRQETFTESFIYEIIMNFPDLIHQFYLQFANVHYISTGRKGGLESMGPTLSFQYLQKDPVLNDEELERIVQNRTSNANQYLVMSAFRLFNKFLLKTNFFQPTKVAISFRFDPCFLPRIEYPQPLFGMFLIVGSEFRGFHLRFRNVARGGIRIVRSRNNEAYLQNARSLFDENYNLANTQQRKNKDIPEGGAKGVILLDANKQDKAEVAFYKYIDSLIDLLLEGKTPGIKEKIIDRYGHEEILFCGPDEGTAPLVDWATEHAKARGAPWWKSFFTGKSPKLGGIPHDVYGMTSLSVRQYVNDIYEKLDINSTKMEKVQTGGPDGDLGSNEIKLSNEKYIAIIDGSGVLHDPEGIDRNELLRLAKARKMISEFDISKLSSKGYRVLVEENNLKLPTGEVIVNATAFRNSAHLRYKCDILVPCGGRPEAINAQNVDHLIKNGQSIIKYIVEGANLFITQEAKLKLEKAGCLIIKDASANKGGVTSSSLEVLASLSFGEEDYIENMCVRDGKIPDFYKKYVKEVQEIIQSNADREFQAIWRERQASGKSASILSDDLSNAIINLRQELLQANLWANHSIRGKILLQSLPKTLVEKLTLSKIMERVPEPYLRAIFASHLASSFIYECGINPGSFAFYGYMSKIESNEK